MGRDCEFVVSSKDRLFLVSHSGGIVCFDAAADTWYGPLQPASNFSCERPLGTAEGLWVGGEQGTVFIRSADFLDAAKAAGRVITTAQVRHRKQASAEKAGPLAAACFDLTVGDFDGAHRHAEALLASTPNDPQAMLVMAALNDVSCLNRPEDAMTWYRKLAAMETDPSAMYTGLCGEMRMNYELHRWDDALKSAERLLQKVPCPAGFSTAWTDNAILAVEAFMREARKMRDAATAKPEQNK